VAAVGAAVAGTVAFLSTAFLMRYFRGNDKWALDPFAYYCALAAIAAGAWLMFA
jgi:undecaprenyl-diphosphatase